MYSHFTGNLSFLWILCLNEIGLHVQNMVIILSFAVNIIGKGGGDPFDHLFSILYIFDVHVN